MRKFPAIALLALTLLGVGAAQAEELDALRGKLERGREEAGALRAEIVSVQERLLAAEAEAGAAAARERGLAAQLREGRARAAALAAEARSTTARLARERQRSRRAQALLEARLVAIYTTGMPSTASLVLASEDLDDLAVRSEYLERIESSDSQLAARVAAVRDEVRGDLARVVDLKARVEEANRRVAAAREQIAAVRDRARAAAAALASLRAARSAALARLKSRIETWVAEVEEIEAASRAAAESTIGRWLGGPYAIPTYIVMCESGGNYSALNPSSGAGGAYQIMPETWRAYGGKGAPHLAPKAEQDRIAAAIWADSGSSPWVCG